MKNLLVLALLAPLFLISCGKTEEVKTVENPPVVEKQTVATPPVVESPVMTTGGVVESGSGEIEETSTGVVSESGISDSQTRSTNLVSFSDEQIKEILAKLNENIKKQREQSRNGKEVLVQGDIKVEYIKPKDYSKDTDKIIVTHSGKMSEFPGIYGEKEKHGYLEAIKKGKCRKDNIITEPSYVGCITSSDFSYFDSFSPSGYYVLYHTHGYEYEESKLMDIRTGKISIHPHGKITTSIWTNDKMQFIYGGDDRMGNGLVGLYVTKKGSFPDVDTISKEHFVQAILVDNNYIYALTNNDGITQILYVHDLKTLKEVFSKKITN